MPVVFTSNMTKRACPILHRFGTYFRGGHDSMLPRFGKNFRSGHARCCPRLEENLVSCMTRCCPDLEITFVASMPDGAIKQTNPKPPTGPGHHHRDDIHGCNRLRSGALYRLPGNIPEGPSSRLGQQPPPEGGGAGPTLRVRFFYEFPRKSLENAKS